MADHEDPNTTLPELGDLPDLGGGDELGLPDLGGGDDLPDLSGGDLPNLGAVDDLPDLGADIPMGNDPLADLSMVDKTDSGAMPELTSQDTPSMAPVSTPSGDSIIAFKKIQGIKVNVQVILGETKLSVSQLSNLKKGEFIQLDTKVGEAVDIVANGALIARGEIAVEDEDAPRFGITLTEIIDSSAMAN